MSTCRARRFSYAETKTLDRSFRLEKPENNSGEPCNPLSNAGLRKIDRFATCARPFFRSSGYIAEHEIDSCNKYAARDGKSDH